ncbi:MAG: PIN domain-containing protein [Verrucomicrobiota bacterium]
MILADSGYLIALAKPRDALHSKAVAWSRLVDEPLLVSEYVLWETVNYLSLLRDRSKAHPLVEQVMNVPPFVFVPASPELFAAGLRLHRERPDKEWSLTDCVSFHLMRERGLTRALAYDAHFEQAGFEALLRRDPPA